MIDLLYTQPTNITTLINKIVFHVVISFAISSWIIKKYPMCLSLSLYLRKKLQGHNALKRPSVSPLFLIFYSAQLLLNRCTEFRKTWIKDTMCRCALSQIIPTPLFLLLLFIYIYDWPLKIQY